MELTVNDLVRQAQSLKLTPDERRAQRQSMILGLRPNNSPLSRDEAIQLLEEIEGSGTVVVKTEPK